MGEVAYLAHLAQEDKWFSWESPNARRLKLWSWWRRTTTAPNDLNLASSTHTCRTAVSCSLFSRLLRILIMSLALSEVLYFTNVPNPVTAGEPQAIEYTTNDTQHPVTLTLLEYSVGPNQVLTGEYTKEDGE